MEFLSVLLAAIASYAFGAVWYMVLSKPWMEAAGVARAKDGRPANSRNPAPYIIAFIAAILVAGMMRHIFSWGGFDSVLMGLMGGLGLGLFIATPWVATNYAFAGRPIKLTLIDGGYATIGCTIMGVVLTML